MISILGKSTKIAENINLNLAQQTVVLLKFLTQKKREKSVILSDHRIKFQPIADFQNDIKMKVLMNVSDIESILFVHLLEHTSPAKRMI